MSIIEQIIEQNELLLAADADKPQWVKDIETAADNLGFDPDLPYCIIHWIEPGVTFEDWFKTPDLIPDYSLGYPYALTFGTTILAIGEGVKEEGPRGIVRECIWGIDVTAKEPSARKLADNLGVSKTVTAEELKRWRTAKGLV